jgi:FixJ family two-component response regulator
MRATPKQHWKLLPAAPKGAPAGVTGHGPGRSRPSFRDNRSAANSLDRLDADGGSCAFRQDGNTNMSAKAKVCIIDANDRRRTALEAKLSRAFAVTVLRQPGELVAAWPEADAAFVADEYGNLMHVRHIAVQKQEVLPIVAFGEAIDTDQAITAIYAGAIDCIDLKRHRSDLAQRLELALRRRSPEFETRLRAMRSASELAGLDRGKRRILGLFASGKGHERISRELGMTETQLEGEIDEIKRQLRLPSLKDAVRMMIDYFR